jgi:hypothetical protein
MPDPFRASSAVVADHLNRRWSERLIVPSPNLCREIPERLHSAGITGGATYDGLVALTAAKAGRVLVTMDSRARRTYERLGIRHRILGA